MPKSRRASFALLTSGPSPALHLDFGIRDAFQAAIARRPNLSASGRKLPMNASSRSRCEWTRRKTRVLDVHAQHAQELDPNLTQIGLTYSA